MPSETYRLFAKAIRERKQIVCTYQNYLREVCPIILGHTDGREQALTLQFAGGSSRGLPPGGQWRCLRLAEIGDVRLREGPWYSGEGHSQPQGCVEDVDLDVNPNSPYDPKRPLNLKASRRRR